MISVEEYYIFFILQCVILPCSYDRSPGIVRKADWIESSWCTEGFVGAHDSLSSTWSSDKTLSHQIQFPPVASLSAASDKCEFDMTLSKSDVMKMHHICVCVYPERSKGVQIGNKTGKMAMCYC